MGNFGSKQQSGANAKKDPGQVFISYTWNDTKTDVQNYARHLEQRNICDKVWIDVEEMRNDMLEKMVVEVKSSDVVVIFWNPEYFESRSCKSEALTAYNHNKNIVFVKMIEDRSVRRSFNYDEMVPNWFQGIMQKTSKWIDYYESEKQAVDEIDKSIIEYLHKLGKSINTDESLLLGTEFKTSTYVQREATEKDIQQRVKALIESKFMILLLYGTAGHGKTWCVREALASVEGRKFLKSQCNVCFVMWVNCQKFTNGTEQFDKENFIQHLHTEFNLRNSNPNYTLQELKAHLRSLKKRGKVLLILDDVYNTEVFDVSQRLDPENLSVVAISQTNFTSQAVDLNYLDPKPLALGPMDDPCIKTLVTNKFKNARWYYHIGLQTLDSWIENIKNRSAKFVLLAEMYANRLCKLSDLEAARKVYQDFENSHANILRERRYSVDKDVHTILELSFLNDLPNRTRDFQLRVHAFLMFEPGQFVNVNDLIVLWHTDTAQARIFAEEICDSSLIHKRDEAPDCEYYMHGAVYTSVLNNAGVVYSQSAGRRSLTLNELRTYFVAAWPLNSETSENILHSCIRAKNGTLLQLVEQVLFKEPENRLLFQMCSQQSKPSKETPLHLLLKTGREWNSDEKWERVLADDICYVSDVMLRISKDKRNGEAKDLLTKLKNSDGHSILDLMSNTAFGDKWRQNALFVAVGRGYRSLFELMLQNWDRHIFGTYLFDADRNNILMVAAEQCQSPIIADILRSIDPSNPWIDVNAQNDTTLKTALIIACEKGDEISINYMLRYGANLKLNIHDNGGYTALMIACSKGLPVAAKMMGKGADPKMKSLKNESCLWLALLNGHSGFAKSINLANVSAELTNAEIACLEEICRFRHIENELQPTSQEINNFQLLKAFCIACDLDELKVQGLQDYIFDQTANVNTIPQNKQEDFFLLASFLGLAKKLEVLSNVRPDLLKCRNRSDWTPLMLAASNGHVSCFGVLARPEVVDYREFKFQKTALALAVNYGQLDAVKALIETYGANDEIRDANGENILMMACKTNNRELLAFLLEKTKIDPNSVDINESTLLMFAMKYCSEEIILFLLSREEIAKSINAQNCNCETALTYAVERSDSPEFVLQLIRDYKANVNVADVDGETLLMTACKCGYEKTVEQLLKISSVKANIDGFRLDGITALSIAARRGYVNIAKMLLEAGANVNSKACNGYSALMWASQIGHESMVDFLLKHQPNLDYQSDKSLSALQMAIDGGHAGICDKLCSAAENTSTCVGANNNSSSNKESGLDKRSGATTIFFRRRMV